MKYVKRRGDLVEMVELLLVCATIGGIEVR